MVFGSFQFIFLFLPLVALGFFYLGRKNPWWAQLWLLLASLVFYSSWTFKLLPVLALSTVGNYAVIGWLSDPSRAATSRSALLKVAVAANLALLVYFKYANFFISSINTLSGTELQLLHIMMPIGISFFTFTQISFLVDAAQGKATPANFTNYFLFTSYFPYIVAGPVLHHREILPQIADRENYRIKPMNVAVGLSLFAFGLAKKALIADNLVPIVDTVFATDSPKLLQAWIGILAYSFQLYFDFSGYSDMAIGVSRLFGIQIPYNFNSPYKAASVSEFWLRWHISLSRFLRNYLYIPLGGNRCGPLNRYRNLLLTMLLGGLWHGSNWTFVVWGGLHGLYLCVQHGWQALRGPSAGPSSAASRVVGRVLTFVAVLIAWCFFRANDLGSAWAMLSGMAGAHGVTAVSGIALFDYVILVVSAFIIWFMPNTNEIFLYLESRYEPPLAAFSLVTIRWRPVLRWGITVGLVLALAIMSMDKTKDFIYAQF